MKNINLKQYSMEELAELYSDASQLLFAESKVMRKQFVREMEQEWKEIGSTLKKKREELKITLRELSGMIGCSETKVRNFEYGRPVQYARMLENSYKMALRLHKIKQGFKL